ncbi:HDOD domain-containing protein [uncultured Paraglaciecola sp.]|uniref:HDOD domain-containing protein n=1 Tax=uncultured Paraglaciecola sp. TaxID=1765024 RepID=UPI002595F83E|nr:HDOD domain-containing protein [uncultured Paraglaciecola sp.]
MDLQDYVDNAGDIFVLPEAVIKIKQLIDDDAASLDDIAEVINYDPAIMTQVLKISNSALYKFPNTITTVSKAIQVIGTHSIYDLVLAYGVASAFKDIATDVIDLDKYWEESVFCGLLCKYLADELGLKEPEKLFVCGLLHNLGELVMVQLNPENAKKCMDISSKRPLQQQKQHLGFSYVDISSRLLDLWGIPSDIVHIVESTHGAQQEPMTQEQQVIQLGYLLALNNINNEHFSRFDGVTPEMYGVLNLDKESIDNAVDFSNLQLMSALALFSPSSFALF